MKLIPKNWEEHQHYKNRFPPWIKLHKKLLNDRDFMCLPIASKALAPLLWLLASESKEDSGEFNASTEELMFRLRFTEKEIESARKPLIDKGFFILASTTLALCKQVAPESCSEKRREETETETDFERWFLIFWEKYPSCLNKTGRKAALEEFKKLKPTKDLFQQIMDGLDSYCCSKKVSDGYVFNPKRWLKEKHWEDVVEQQSSWMKEGS